MELGGTEKRIQALFSELSLEDRSRVPHFEHLWTRAAATNPARIPLFSKSFAVAAIVLAVAGSFAIWSRSITQNALNIAPLEIPTAPLPRVDQLAAIIDTPRLPLAHRPKR